MNLAHSSVPLASHLLGLASHPHPLPVLDFFLAPLLGQEGRVRLWERRASERDIYAAHSHCLLLCVLLGKVFILLMYKCDNRALVLSMQVSFYKGFKMITSLMLPQISWEQLRNLAWAQSFLSSDGYRSKTRMKAKLNNCIINTNNIAQQCLNSFISGPLYTLKNNWRPQRAVVYVGYSYQYLPYKILKQIFKIINSFKDNINKLLHVNIHNIYLFLQYTDAIELYTWNI